MQILICPNAFKGSLTAVQAAAAIDKGISLALYGCHPCLNSSDRIHSELTVRTIQFPLADGGDGTLETLVSATGGEMFHAMVRGPLGSVVDARWGRLGGSARDTAVIEMAEASGLRLIRSEQRDPLRTTTYGTGELMRAALENGCRKIIVGIGGSATNDGGAGMAQALGVRLVDSNEREIPPGGAALVNLARVDRSGFFLPPDIEVIVACDVDNPLCGSQGASAVYGPQKGATEEMIAALDSALANYSDILQREFGRDIAFAPGAGAAGGLGAGLMAFCGAGLRSGTDIVLELAGFDAKAAASDLIITGEGRLDGQTARGKLIAGVAARAKIAGVPVIALAGSIEPGADELLREIGVDVSQSILDRPLSTEEAMDQAEELLVKASCRMMRLLMLNTDGNRLIDHGR